MESHSPLSLTVAEVLRVDTIAKFNSVGGGGETLQGDFSASCIPLPEPKTSPIL